MSFLIDILWSSPVFYFVLGYCLSYPCQWIFEKLKLSKLARFHTERAIQRKNTRDKNLRDFVSRNKFPDESRREDILKHNSLSSLRKALDDQKISSEELVLTYIYQ